MARRRSKVSSIPLAERLRRSYVQDLEPSLARDISEWRYAWYVCHIPPADRVSPLSCRESSDHHYPDRAFRMPLIACHACGLVHKVAELPDWTSAVCTRCGAVLVRQSADGIARAFALNLAALLLFGVANTFPLMTMKLAGQAQTSTLLEGVLALLD